MSVLTVNGPVDAGVIGVTAPHEHLYIDLSVFFHEPEENHLKKISHSPITIDKLGILKRNPYALNDNLMLTDPDIQIDELLYFKDAGGQTVVDVTTVGIGRNPMLLQKAAEVTGLNIVAGSGFYVADALSPDIKAMSISAMEAQMVQEIETGIGDTGIRAGIIGEIGISYEMHPFEQKCLIAACRAQKRTGAPLMVHINPWSDCGLDAVRIIQDHRIAPSKVVLCHVDADIRRDYLIQLLDTGVFVEFDNFGKEMFIDRQDLTPTSGRFATDWERVKIIKELVDLGYEAQLLFSCDICLKTLLHKYGGWGYDHVLTHIVPMLDEVGVRDSVSKRIMTVNPAMLLDFES
jgi:phosphotriesterase-related protein